MRLACRSVVVVGLRAPRGELFAALEGRGAETAAAGIRSVERAGDVLAPGAIVHAVHSGHRVARELGAGDAAIPYRRDFPIVGKAASENEGPPLRKMPDVPSPRTAASGSY